MECYINKMTLEKASYDINTVTHYDKECVNFLHISIIPRRDQEVPKKEKKKDRTLIWNIWNTVSVTYLTVALMN